MLSVKEIKPKMLSDFLGLPLVNGGRVIFDSKRVSIQEFISIFCFERYLFGFSQLLNKFEFWEEIKFEI